ncbi:hypothetical protein ACHQM5_013992 [Ranunculus cassubicifolius]
MDLRLLILSLLPLLCLQIRAEDNTGSILFVDGPNQQFLRSHPSDDVTQTSSMSLSDVGAAISVLLGFSPPASLSEDSSSKLNEILSANPFSRPRAVVMLEINGIEDQRIVDHLSKCQVGSVIRSKVLLGSEKAEIQLPGKDEVSVMSLDESLGSECDASCIDKELEDLATLLGVSYGSKNLHMSEKPDEEFMLRLLSLVRNMKKAMEKHADFSKRIGSPAELIIGSFSGLKVLQEKYGHDGASQQGTEFFLTTLTKLFNALQEAYQGQIVVVYYSNANPNVELGSISNVKIATRPSPRWLGEALNSTASTAIAEIVLVRLTLAWITGIILLLSTLLGIYYLLYMPITRDTLLYSNVKLD